MTMNAFVDLVKDYGLLDDFGLDDNGIASVASDCYEKKCFDNPPREESALDIDRIIGALGMIAEARYAA